MRLVKSCLRLTFFLVLCFGPALPYVQRSEDLTENVISSLNSVLDFFKRDYRSINLDGIFGLRVAQGAFLSIINDLKDGQVNVEDSVLKQVKGLHNKASVIAQDALPFLQESSPEYFMKFKKQVSYPWSNFKPFTNKKLAKRQYKPENRRNAIDFDEGTSDECMTGLTGTSSSSEGRQACHISDKCWGLITTEGAQGYALTHQALFFQLGETQDQRSVQACVTRLNGGLGIHKNLHITEDENYRFLFLCVEPAGVWSECVCSQKSFSRCTPIFQKRLEKSNIKGGLEEIYNRICSDMYPEMTATEQKITLDQSTYQRDLYMEQAMVCGSLGYGDFLSTERLERILSWQRDDGCFGRKKDGYQDDDDDDETVQFPETNADDVKGQQNEFIDKSETDGTEKREIDSPFGNIKKSLEYKYSQILRRPLGMRTMRSLLIEKELDDGCLSHITGVATGLLGVYLRWLLYSQEPPFQKHNELNVRKSPQSQETEVYVNENLVDAITLKENRLVHQKKMKQDQMQTAHLMQMRRAAMLDKGGLLIEKNVGEREGVGSVSGRVIVFGSILLLLVVLLVRGFKRMPSMVRMFTRMKKHTHVI